MNQGGEPAHDDYGLPPVDVEIPDDARELDRDVQAYHRELRALRRHQRSNRWRTSLRRSGMVVPLMAGGLILAMIAGMVLTMFSANPYFSGPAGLRQTSAGPHSPVRSTHRAGAPSAAPSASTNGSGGSASLAATHLPAGKISVAGQPVDLSALAGVALAIVPANCGCAAAIGRLLAQATLAKVRVYLVGINGLSLHKLSRFAPASANGTATLATDTDKVLTIAYQPAGLVLVLVDAHHRAKVQSSLPRNFSLEQELRAIRQAH